MKGELKDYEKRSYDENPVKITYYVHGQKATKAEYSAYIKKLIKNSCRFNKNMLLNIYKLLYYNLLC